MCNKKAFSKSVTNSDYLLDCLCVITSPATLITIHLVTNKNLYFFHLIHDMLFCFI